MDCVTSHEEVSWPFTLRQEIPNIHIFGHINVNKGVFCLMISYLQIQSYNVLNYNNCSTDWPFPLMFDFSQLSVKDKMSLLEYSAVIIYNFGIILCTFK
jgi:hypothetical protein